MKTQVKKISFALLGLFPLHVTAADCQPTQLTWGANNLCSVLSTFVADGDSRTLISPPRKEAGKIVGVGTATFRCEVGTFKQVSATCDGGTDAYASTRATTLPTPQNVALPKIGTDADLSPYKTGAVAKASTVTQLTNEVGSWESQMSKDMKAQEARMVAYTDTKTNDAVTTSRSYTDTKSSQTLASANSYTNTKSSETLASANSYANTRANQALASANSYTDTKANQTLASANSYTDSKATQTLNSANSYTNSKSTETLNSANSYTNTKSTQTLNSANAYTDSKATATLNSANTYTNNTNATTLANSKSYTDSKSASTLTAANNYTDQEVAGVSGQSQSGSVSAAWWTPYVGQTYSVQVPYGRNNYVRVQIVDSAGSALWSGFEGQYMTPFTNRPVRLVTGGDLYVGSYSTDGGCQSTGITKDYFFVNTANGPGFVLRTANVYSTTACGG